jgi:NADPH2:quinone reductase
MKAIVIREFGPPEVMRLEEVPTPAPEAGEVLIKVHAVSVNRTLDLVVRSGKYAVPVKLPHVLGVDPSGVVAAVGPAAPRRSRCSTPSSSESGTGRYATATQSATIPH